MNLKFLCLFIICYLPNIHMVFAQDTLPNHQKYRLVVFDWQMKGDSLDSRNGEVISNSIRINLVKANCYQNVNILEREDMLTLLSEKSFVDKMPDVFDKFTAISLGKMLQANYVVIGQMTKSTLLENTMISAKLVEIESGNIVGADEIAFTSNSDYDKIIKKITLSIINSTNELGDLFCDKDLVEKKPQKTLEYRSEMSVGIENILNNWDASGLNVKLAKNIDESDAFIFSQAKSHPLVNPNVIDIAVISLNSNGVILINEEGFYWRVENYENAQVSAFKWTDIKGIKIKRKEQHMLIGGDQLDVYNDEQDNVEKLIRQLENYIVKFKRK